ncbi:MAG: COX15/CtaA family protein [Chromatiales bacterium]|nr:COX15/CtaA family protein [Chromatiales bacterium]
MLGAYVRLSDAGLGCPDWPGCYGHLTDGPMSARPDRRRATPLTRTVRSRPAKALEGDDPPLLRRGRSDC